MNILFLVFLFPLLGFLILAFGRGKIPEKLAAVIGVGSIGLSALVAAIVGAQFLQHPPADGAYVEPLWTWMQVGGFAPQFALRLDGLSLTMMGVITGVGFLIHLFASWYMRRDEGYGRFFSYMNLFVASMLFLVLGDNLLFLYFGWEGVGLCSYLLIGFWYQDPANGAAARKAFIVTRVGDTFMAIGLFLLFQTLGTLNIQEILQLAPQAFHPGSLTVTAIALLLLGGAVGKSAQLPLQTWLPDAMAGPTPVSALIHAATMVTAGVYLIARTHTLFELAPFAQEMVGLVGAVTLLLAGFTALVQTDIKRVLAYSTMSQIGYMFLALGAGAWSAAVFHLMTHAFFKALLFLASGAVILACHHEQDIRKMGGLRKKIPLAFWSFVVGGSALAAVPYLTAGFFSKDEILWQAYAGGHIGLFWAGLLGAFLTSLYTFRLIFTVFFGEAKTDAHAGHGVSYWLPLSVLLVLSTFVGGMIHPPLANVLPANPAEEGGSEQHLVEALSGFVAICGIAIAGWRFFGQPRLLQWLEGTGLAKLLSRYWYSAFGFDWLYDRLFVKPFLWLVRINSKDVFDQIIGCIPVVLVSFNKATALSQSGRLRWYTASVAFGAVLIIAAVVVYQ
ncbi:NADH-quinone oxidoreductase subunit L [Nevskia soli]|uniref:NADH-quinone oxidoreductase subunit L n=1 Tax=Nevskia soli TaxID=418856 RepID=UPI0004A727E9|nr:NADH-quinone oxidoreductase subunit L [Nevskia soli]